MIWIKEAKYIKGFEVQLLFNTGEKGVVNLVDQLKGPIFESLKNPADFSKLLVNDDLGTVVWENGADFAPEFLYELAKTKK